MMRDLGVLQVQHQQWLRRNFPSYEPWECLVGAMEELGELSHAFLKQHQAERGEARETLTSRDLRAEEHDAVGDIIIFLSGYCTARGIDLARCVDIAWSEVSRRKLR